MRSRRARVMGALVGALFVCVASAQTVSVQHAIDGDSLLLPDGRHVRLIGINTPEFGRDGQPDQPLARAAQARAADLTRARSVTLTFDREAADRHGRLLAYASLADGTDLQLTLLREGLAWCVAIPPNTARVERYCAAEREARAARRGIWAESAYRPVAAERVPAGDTGFKDVSGTVRRIGRGRSLVYFDLAPRFTVVVPNDAWDSFPPRARPEVGARIVARGWVTEYKNGLRLRVTHPAMLEIVP